MNNSKTKTKVPSQLVPFVNARIAQRQSNLTAVKLIVSDLTEPASVAEIRALAERTLGAKMHEHTVSEKLTELLKSGEIFARTETKTERLTRAGGNIKGARGTLGVVYFGRANMPERKTTSIVPGIILGDGSSESASQRRARIKYRRRQKSLRRRSKTRSRAKANTKAKAKPVRPVDAVAAVENLMSSHAALSIKAEQLSRENAELRDLLAKITRIIN